MIFYSILVVIAITLPHPTASSEKVPTCSDGNKPLLDENRILFSCQRGCPSTFYCENQYCCPNTTALLSSSPPLESNRNKKNVEFQLESSSEFERTMSCERFPYKLSCTNSTSSQPLAKWYFDIQTLSCELYPFGMCDDDPLDKLALRTREECEERCDVAKVKEALGSWEIKPTPESGAQIAIDDVIQESKHIRGRPFAIEPPTDLIHVIHVKSDTQKLRNREKETEIDENQLLTTTLDDDTVPTVTSDILEVLAGEGSGEDNGVEIERSSKFERQQRKKSVKEMEDSFERFYQRNKDSVACSSSVYRLLCSTGAPSQFVYRWEKVGGVCQSFPFGYCLHETNVPHPRTRAECEQFCD